VGIGQDSDFEGRKKYPTRFPVDAGAMLLSFPDSRTMSQIYFCSIEITWPQVFCYSNRKHTETEEEGSLTQGLVTVECRESHGVRRCAIPSMLLKAKNLLNRD
jgi:hypothetical protein